MSTAACLSLPLFSELFLKRHDFRGGIKNKMYVLIFSANLSENVLILIRIQRIIVINVSRSSYKTPVVPVIF